MIKNSTVIRCLFAIITAIGSESALAEPVAEPVWQLGLGVGGLHYPDYLGSDEYNTLFVPWPYVYYRSERLSVDRNAVRGELLETNRFTLDVSLSGSIPVDSDDNDARRGMPDLRPILEFGPSLKYRLYDDSINRVTLALPLRAAIASDIRDTRYIGVISNPNLTLERRQTVFDTPLNIAASVGPLFAENRYFNYFYGVKDRFANADRETFSSDGGFGGWRLSVGASGQRGRLWYGAFARYFDLSGAEFEDSPLVERRDAFTVGFAVAWIFYDSSAAE